MSASTFPMTGVALTIARMLTMIAALCLLLAAPLGAEGQVLSGGPGEDMDDLRTCCHELHDQDCTSGDDDCRLYAAKILGITFANVRTSAAPGVAPVWNSPTSNNGSVFTAALAGGVRVPRDLGAIRLECEGALRDNFNQATNPANQTAINVHANDNWSALANVWRDVPLTQRLGAYAGGGVGGGGYWLDVSGPDGSIASAQKAVFAWQAGAGAVLKYNSLIDLDVSYRFLDFGHVNAALQQPGLGSVGTISSKMTAGELFFMLRVYEPFQWRKHLRSREFYLPDRTAGQ